MARTQSRLIIRQNANGCQFCSSHAANGNGYTMYTLPGEQPRPLYQIRYEAAFGKRKEGERLRRTCKGGKACVNPEHYHVHTPMPPRGRTAPESVAFCGKKFRVEPHVLMAIVNEKSGYTASKKYGVSHDLATRVRRAHGKAHGTHTPPNRNYGFGNAHKTIIPDETIRAIFEADGTHSAIGEYFGVGQSYVTQIKKRKVRRKATDGLVGG